VARTVVPYFFYAAGILFREGLEALLVVIALVAGTREAGHENRTKDIYIGALVAVGASIALAWGVNHLISDDASDALDPHSIAAAGVDLDRLLWVRCGDETLKNSSSKQTHTECPISRAPSAREACPELAERVGISPQPAFNFEATKSHASEHRLEQVLRATDLLLESGGFGLIVLDLADLPPQAARRIPLTTWFRFRRAVENKPTILLAIEQHPIAGSCSSLLLQLGSQSDSGETVNREQSNASREAAKFISPGRKPWVAEVNRNKSRRDGTDFGDTVSDDATNIPNLAHPAHAQLLTGLQITAELTRSRLERKPARSMIFETRTAWTG